MQSRAWSNLLISGATIAAVAAFTIDSIGPALAVLYGVTTSTWLLVKHRPTSSAHDRPWRKILAASLLVYVNIVARVVHGLFIGQEYPVPSPIADLLVVAIYVLLMSFQIDVVRLRNAGRDLDAWLDAAVGVGAVGAVMWLTVMHDYVFGDTAPLGERAINSMYFALSLALLVTSIRLLAAPGRRGEVHYLFTGAISVLFLADLGGTLAFARGTDPSILVAAIPLMHGLTTAAMMHPKRPELTAEPDDVEPPFRLWRGLVLAAGITLPWGLILFQRGSLGEGSTITLLVAGPVLATLIIWRVVRLIRTREQLLHQADGLREVGDDLLSDVRQSRELAATAIGAVAELMSDTPLGVAAKIDDVTLGDHTLIQLVGDETRAEFRSYSELGGRPVAIFGTEIGVNNTRRGWVAIAAQHQTLRHDRQALRALAREVSMALEGAERAAAVAEAEAERRFTRAIVESERRQRALLLRSSDIVAVLSEDWTISYLSPPIHDVLGFQPIELVGSSLRHLLSGESLRAFEELIRRATSYGTSSGEVPLLHRDGTIRHLQLVLGDHRADPDIEGIVINARDLSATRALEEQLERDPITGTLNRDAFLERADRQISAQPAVIGHRAVLVLEVAEVDLVTSATGYDSSDALLVDIADRLRTNLRIGDDVARISGSTFAVLLDKVLSSTDLMDVGQRIVNDVARPISIDGGEVELVVEAGAVLCIDPLTASEFLSQALTARVAASNSSSNIELYEEGIEDGYRLQLELRTRMRQALETGEFFLHYQPIFDMKEQRVVGAEALARWIHPERGPVGPDIFIAEAERSGLIGELGEWVIRTAAAQVAAWRDLDLISDTFSVAVNVSAGQLDDELVPTIRSIMAEHDLDARQIRIELTESMFTHDDEYAARLLGELSLDGHRLAIDDFGTGTSNLARLGKFSIDYVKLDRSLITPLDERGAKATYLVDNTLKLIESIGADAIAEGIETATQAMRLRDLGCRLVQGYFYGRPCAAEDFTERFLDPARTESLALSNR